MLRISDSSLNHYSTAHTDKALGDDYLAFHRRRTGRLLNARSKQIRRRSLGEKGGAYTKDRMGGEKIHNGSKDDHEAAMSAKCPDALFYRCTATPESNNSGVRFPHMVS